MLVLRGARLPCIAGGRQPCMPALALPQHLPALFFPACSALTSNMSLTLSPCKPTKRKDGDGVIEQIEKVPARLPTLRLC